MTSILVLDDRAADRELLATLLDHAGYSVLQASSGDEGLEIARFDRPDLVITDILMPRMNGYEFVQRLRSDPDTRPIPVIFCTANYAEGEVERLAAACGVSDFITKPSDPESVVAKVGEVLGSPRTLPAPVAAEDFDREQLRVVNDKLVEKVGQLEAVSAERRKVLAQLISAHEDERRQVAEELHDDSIQGVAALGLHLGMLAERTDLEPDLAAALRRLQGDATTAISGLRRMLFELQPIELDHGGLAPALEVVLQHALQEDELEYVFVDHTAREASAPTRTLLYRAAREALANVRKHAGAANVQVTLDEQDGGFMVTVSDDGRGFDSAQALRVRPGHLGLAAIRERVEVAGGRLRLDGRAGAGTFEVWVPELAPAPVQS